MAKVVIESFMTTELGLNGNQLVLFAVLWAESDKGNKQLRDDYSHYSAAMNVSIPTYYNTMKKLCESGVIRQTEKGGTIDVLRKVC